MVVSLASSFFFLLGWGNYKKKLTNVGTIESLRQEYIWNWVQEGLPAEW